MSKIMQELVVAEPLLFGKKEIPLILMDILPQAVLVGTKTLTEVYKENVDND